MMAPSFRPAHVAASPARHSRNEGFTLIELMTTVAIVGLLTTAAVPQFASLIASKRSKAAATDLYLSLIQARSEAIKRNENVTLAPSGDNWQSGWRILDANNAVIDAHAAVGGITITSSLNSLVFQSSGRPQGTTTPTFLVAATNQASAPSCVSTSLSGRPYAKAAPC